MLPEGVFRLNPKQRHPKSAILAVLACWVVCSVLALSEPWRLLELKVYDWLNVATAPRHSSLPITIVGIDQASISRIDKPWPWPRDLHARLIDRLAQAKASVIAFDLVLPDTGKPGDDRELAAAIQRAGNVVLAGEHAFTENAFAREWLRVDPAPDLLAAGAVTGIRDIALDRDAVIREFPPDENTFWHQIVRTLIKTRPGLVEDPRMPLDAMVRHIGPARTFPYVSYWQVLEGDPSLPPNFFEDQVVIVGRDIRATLNANVAQGETFATPFLGTSRLLTPDAEIQATFIENALMGQAVVPAPQWWNIGLLTVTLLLAGLALHFWHRIRSSLILLAIAAGVVALSTWMYMSRGIWLYTALPLFGLAVSLGVMGAIAFRAERRRVSVLRNSFAKYVSANLVDEIVANESELRLGGESRELTLLFSDLADFTTICENIPPEKVAELVNLYANEMTRIIMAHGGTVDKFIGDSVMAFWGAPRPDPQQAEHAVRAAIAMSEAMQSLQPRFSEMGAGRLRVRIGIHSGPAIVGNMGSDLRFEYTALGDTVNLASRLEGANKTYGTTILMSSATAEKLPADLRVRRVDRTPIKGKQVAVDVFTPCDNPAVVESSEAAWQAYLRRDWQTARDEWLGIQALDPYDAVSQLMLARVERFMQSPPPAGWDGTFTGA